MTQLQPQPKLGGCIQSKCQEPCGVWGDVALSVDNFVDLLDRYLKMDGQFSLRKTYWFDVFFLKDHTRVRGYSIAGNHDFFG